ncbi:POTRA domain-containing protein [Achromobacter xylosoxidans]|uniref:POTRA domain-containing protein n=2 Tax=Alcaligenes xylosoxydans xylosoxydans TaxID=85698 RepID=UPI001F149610
MHTIVSRSRLRQRLLPCLALCVSSIASLTIPPALAAQSLPAEAAARASDIQRRQEQELDAQRARAAERPDVLSAPSTGAGEGPLVFPVESPCFTLDKVVWDGSPPPAALRRDSEAALGRCVGGQGLQALQAHLMARLIDRGLITARVLVPEQSLASGTLTLRYVPGRIAGVKSDGAPGWWRTALPTWPGGEVNQRDLDQALENIRRLAGQADASIDVAPGPELGDSDIIIKPGTGKRWHAYVGGDNAGMEATGKNPCSPAPASRAIARRWPVSKSPSSTAAPASRSRRACRWCRTAAPATRAPPC